MSNPIYAKLDFCDISYLLSLLDSIETFANHIRKYGELNCNDEANEQIELNVQAIESYTKQIENLIRLSKADWDLFSEYRGY